MSSENRILDRLVSPAELKKLSPEQRVVLAKEIREEIIQTVSRTGGHLASNLGVVELAIALHSAFYSPKDKIIWDVSHQSYPHKMLTGRLHRFPTLRQHGGISGFTRRGESEHDPFGAGHASTSISAALGFAKARDLKGGDESVVAVIGDGSITGGLALEGFNHAGDLGTDIIVVLNDNEMSISENVGAMALHLAKLRLFPLYQRVENKARETLDRLPVGGKALKKTAEGIYHGVTHLVAAKTGVVFEEMGFKYIGPIDGHNVQLLIEMLEDAKRIGGPVLLHVLTKKGKGYEHAENNSRVFHGITGFDIADGKIEKVNGHVSYTRVFADTLCELAKTDERIVAITAAMPDGTGLSSFAEKYPNRFFDVGIAEEHAVTFAAGLAAGGLRPVVAIYSTFLQRAYDQIVHDVCLQRLPVVFAIDRAGLAADDGPTHHGAFDLSYLRHIPGLVVMAPKDTNELRDMLATAMAHDGPIALRYPKGGGPTDYLAARPRCLSIGNGETLRSGDSAAIIALGSMVVPALEAADLLVDEGIEVDVINARFARPLDEKRILEALGRCGKAVVVEENSIIGGFGSAVLELASEAGLIDTPILRIGLPDAFVEHGSAEALRENCGLYPSDIAKAVRQLMASDEVVIESIERVQKVEG
jgi:1-deoxy-D-xylulose-5-phosphate synthase